MKKIFSLIFSLLLVCVLSTPAFAAEPEIQLYSFTINEYDAYIAARAAVESELKVSTTSTQEANFQPRNCTLSVMMMKKYPYYATTTVSVLKMSQN